MNINDELTLLEEYLIAQNVNIIESENFFLSIVLNEHSISSSQKIIEDLALFNEHLISSSQKIIEDLALFNEHLISSSQKIIEDLDLLQVRLSDQTILKIKISDEFFRKGKQYTYSEIIIKYRDLSQIVDNFLPDWHTLRYLQKESILDRASIARVAVALSNLFRLAVDNEIDEIHLVTLRIRKMFIEEINKNVFIVTDY
jgi:hypothetical protein